jgi:nucleoid DNA-binding protein
MNRTRVAALVAARCDIPYHRAILITDTFFEVIVEAMIAREFRVSLPGFGSFVPRIHQPRQYELPVTRRIIKVPAHVVPSFIPSREFIKRMNGGRYKFSSKLS